MKQTLLALTLATAALSGCAQLKQWQEDASASAGTTAYQEPNAFPKSSSNIAGN